jgi:hypothetical protein
MVATALVDLEFCAKLLNGQRPMIITEFDLTEAEKEVVLGIRADTIEEFAEGLVEWLEAEKAPRYSVSAWSGRHTPACALTAAN